MNRIVSTLLTVAMTAGAALLAQDKPQDKPAAKKDPAAEKKKADKNELPLETKDKLEFETDEGTWISLDVTPDGKSIVFELLGDFYRLPIAGGEAARITDGTPYDSQPRVSPDGKWIAFISDRSGSDNLWIAKIDGTEPRKLSNESQDAVISPAWTPDSQYVISSVRATAGTQLRMFHINGGSGITLGAAPATPPAGGAPSPGGASGPSRLGATVSPNGRFVFVAQSATGSGVGRWQVARLDMQSGDVDVITQAEGGAMRPLVSPDGTRLVYGTRHETKTGLRVHNLTTGADRWLKWPIDRDEQESGGSPSRDTMPGYAFMPDGKEIVIAIGGRIHRVNIETGAETLVPFKAKVALDIGPDLTAPYRVPQGPVRAKLIQDPRQSPDGKRLVMSVLTNLYVMDLPKGKPQRLASASDHAFNPTWSPDGQWIAYVTWSPEGTGHIWKIRADGTGQPQQLTKLSAFYTDITFSPDGTRIVGLRGNEYQRQQTFSEFGGLRIPLDLVWLPAGGGGVELIVPARGLGRPHFAADPNRIFVHSNSGLISLRYDGTDRRTHIRVTGPGRAGSPTPPAADTVLISPDGKWALADVNNQLWVVAVPPFTGTAATVSVRSPSLPVKRLTDIGSDYFAWADGGKTITWAIGSTFFRRPFATIDFGPAEPTGRGGGPGDTAKPEEKTDAQKEQEKQDAAKKKEPLDLDKNVERVDVTIEVPRAMPKGTVVLRGATIITMKDGATGDADILKAADIVVTDNRITAIGRGLTIPAGAKVIDARGKFIVPGFVDTHAHWEFRTHDVLEPQNWSLIANLAYGVTAGLDVQTSTNDYFAYQDLVETGQSLGQRAFMTGPGIFSSNDFQSYEATLAYLKRYKEHYRTLNIKSYMVGNRKQRQWVVQAAKELGLMPTTEGGRDMKMDITHAIDGMHGNEHTLPVFPLYKDVVELFARTKTAYTPTLLVNYGGIIAEEYFYTTMEVHDDKKLNRFYPHNVLDDYTRRRRVWARKDEFVFPMAAASAAKIQRAGGLIGVGGHGQLQGLGYHWEMWGLAMGGMTPREVLKAATIDGAKIIGFAEDLGSLEVGKLADLVVLDKNPLADIHNTNSVRYVMKNGELFDGDTLDQIWPAQKKLPKFWWWEPGPKTTR